METHPLTQSPQILRIVVASPSDVQAERDALEAVAEELNHGVAAMAGLRIEIARWETDAHPGFHPQGPQGLIDPILKIEDCDVLIGIFWKHFGTPVGDAKSGTEHEFQIAYEAWKQRGRPQIFVYFNQRAYTPQSSAEIDQWGQVLEFKERFPKEGLWWPYKGRAQFERLVRTHLTRWIRQRVAPSPLPAAQAGIRAAASAETPLEPSPATSSFDQAARGRRGAARSILTVWAGAALLTLAALGWGIWDWAHVQRVVCSVTGRLPTYFCPARQPRDLLRFTKLAPCPEHVTRTIGQHGAAVLSVAFSPDGTSLASASYDDTIKLWDVPTAVLKKTLTAGDSFAFFVAFSVNGTTLAGAGADRTVKLWDVRTGELEKTLAGHNSGSVHSVAFSPDGTSLASASYYGAVKLWNIRTGALKKTLTGHSGSVHSVAFSPDGATLASAGVDGTVRLWNMGTGALTKTLAGHDGSVHTAAFSPDGATLASAGDDKIVNLWNVQTGHLKKTLTGHGSPVLSVAFSPNGTILASASDDRTIRLWDVQTGERKKTLIGHTNRVRSVAFSPDGTILASASNDKTVRLWRIQ